MTIFGISAMNIRYHWYDIADINTAGSCVRLSHAKHRSISIVSNVVATIRPTWPNAWWDPGGTRVGPRAKSRTTTRLPMPCQEDGESEIGIAHHKGIGVGIYELQAVEPHDPEAPWYVTSMSHMYVKVQPMTPIKGLVRKNVPPVVWKTSRKMIIIFFSWYGMMLNKLIIYLVMCHIYIYNLFIFLYIYMYKNK